MKTPVAFIIFKRPDTTEKVFEAIRQAKPSKLFVIADGARDERPGEEKKCEDTRAIIDKVDWECEVLKNYSPINLGCGRRVASGLDWVFQNVEEAIILEDDCVPHPSFFPFCEELLQIYKYDERIMSIGGLSIPHKKNQADYSYHFSLYPRIWGWATWRRAWKYFDFDMKLWPELRNINLLASLFKDNKTVNHWTKIFQSTYEKRKNVWGYQWTFACWFQNGLTIIPCANLVRNIGFGEDATNTIYLDEFRSQAILEKMNFPLQHPPFVTRDFQTEEWLQNNIHNHSFIRRFSQKISKILK
ncbi:MAG: glycosyltransferase family 2 protein [Nostoc sp. TH1S01]|nr:glycosyltransferase family 2 protein [Nostoc sp. TH1S01]